MLQIIFQLKIDQAFLVHLQPVEPFFLSMKRVEIFHQRLLLWVPRGPTLRSAQTLMLASTLTYTPLFHRLLCTIKTASMMLFLEMSKLAR